MMLVNEAETAWRVIDPDLEFAYVTDTIQPSVSQLVERLTVDLYTIFGNVGNQLVAGSIPTTRK